MKNCPKKWPEKSFKENDIFSMKMIVGSTLELSTKVFFSLDAVKMLKNAYKVINCLISQPKLMLWVLKRTVAIRQFF